MNKVVFQGRSRLNKTLLAYNLPGSCPPTHMLFRKEPGDWGRKEKGLVLTFGHRVLCPVGRVKEGARDSSLGKRMLAGTV